MRQPIYAIAAFQCGSELSDAILERMKHAEAIVAEHDVVLPDGNHPPKNWQPAVFLPETGLHAFVDVYDGSGGTYKDASELPTTLPLPENGEGGIYLYPYGEREDVLGFCRTLSHVLGAVCCVGYDLGEPPEDEDETPNAYLATFMPAGRGTRPDPDEIMYEYHPWN